MCKVERVGSERVSLGGKNLVRSSQRTDMSDLIVVSLNLGKKEIF